MSTLTKVFVVLVSVLAIAMSCLFVASAAQWGNYREVAEAYQKQRDAAITDKLNTTATALASVALKDQQLATERRALGALQSEYQNLQNDKAKTDAELAQVKNERMAFEAGRTKLQEILDVQTSQLKSAEKQNQTLLAQNMDLQSRNARMNARVLELSTDKTILTEETRNLQEKLYAAQNIGSYRASGGQPARTTAEAVPGAVSVKPRVAGIIRGQVTSSDGSYASIDVGESSGVVAGMSFMVFRGQQQPQYLGELTVEVVDARTASGKLAAMAQGVDIRRGDLVAYGLENN